MLEQTINHFQSWREAQNPVNSENMYALGLPISVYPTASENSNMIYTNVDAIRMDSIQFFVKRLLGSRTQWVVRKVTI